MGVPTLDLGTRDPRQSQADGQSAPWRGAAAQKDVAFNVTESATEDPPSTVPEQRDEERPSRLSSLRADRAEAIATLAALVWVSGVAIVFAMSGGNISAVGLLAIGPFIAALYARPWRVALVGLLAAFFALVIGTPPHNYGELNHVLRVLTQLAATARGHVHGLPEGTTQRAAVHGPHRDAQRASPTGGRGDRPTHAGHGPGPDHRGGPLPGGRRRLRRPARRAGRGCRDLRRRRRRGHPADPAPVRLRPRRGGRRRAERAPAGRTRPRTPPGAVCRVTRGPQAPARRHPGRRRIESVPRPGRRPAWLSPTTPSAS